MTPPAATFKVGDRILGAPHREDCCCGCRRRKTQLGTVIEIAELPDETYVIAQFEKLHPTREAPTVGVAFTAEQARERRPTVGVEMTR